jgi:hypothetical protein
VRSAYATARLVTQRQARREVTQTETQAPEKPSSPAFGEIMAYGKAHAAGSWLLHAATDDYASARCLCLNLLFPGLVLGAQATEKYLKALLLLIDPGLDGTFVAQVAGRGRLAGPATRRSPVRGLRPQVPVALSKPLPG